MKLATTGKASPINEESIRNPIMKNIATHSRAFICILLTTFGLATGQAQTTITNADSASTLNLPDSWVGGVAAGPANIAVWDSTVQGNLTKTLGANLAWAGIRIFNPAGPVTIGADGNTLTNGASGMDLSQAATGLTVGTPLVLGADQTWTVTNGQTLNINGQLLASTATTLTLNGGGTSQFSSTVNGTYAGNISLNSGILNIGGANANGNSAVGTGVITNNGGTLQSAGKIVGNVLQFNGTSFVDANFTSFTLDGTWRGNGTVIITNLSGTATVTAGGNGNGGGNMANFTGTVIIASTNSDGSPSAGNFRFNNGGANNNLGNAAMTLDLGNGSTHFTEKNNSQTTTFGAVYGGPNTQLAQTEKYVIGALNVPNDVFSGTVTASASTFTKNGTGTFTWNNTSPNTYTGATTVSSGKLQIGDGVTPAAGSLGTGPIVISDPGMLVFNKPDDFEVPNAISGAGTLLKTNVSVMTYDGADTGSGPTIIAQGTLTVGAASAISSPIVLSSGATFDVSQNPAFTLNQSLSGSGTVNGLLTAAGGSINPGQPGVAGTLTFATGLTESGGVNHQFELSAGSNDLINVVGNLTLAGVNNLTLSAFGGGTIPSGVYPLIQYSGTLSGGPGNFSVTIVGAQGTVTNITSTTPAQIAVIVAPAARGPVSLTWKGDGAANNWDGSSSNWVNGATSYNFLPGDSVTFDDSGAPNTNVNLTIPALPASVTFNSTLPYTLAGPGSINGSTGLTKTNSGSLRLFNTNSYTGPTIVGQGTLEIQNIGISGTPSSIGTASSDATNLVLSGGTLKYSGSSTITDHGLSLNGSGGIIDVIDGTTLTVNGNITGAGALNLVDTGTLTLGSANTYTGGTILSNGVLALGSNSANNNGSGGSGLGPTNSPVTFYGGTLQLFGARASQGNNYNTVYNPLVVPAGQSGTLILFPRGPANTGAGAGLFSSLSGSGTMNLVVNYVRDALSGNWSAFSGTIVVTNLNASGDEMRINNNFGYSSAAIYLNGPVTMDSTLSGNATIDIGELGGISTATIGPGNSSAANPTWRVGWKNTTNLFAGNIVDDGHTSIEKVGTGAWYLAGQNTYSGSTIIDGGLLGLTNIGNGDAIIGSSTNIIIGSGAVLDVSGRSDDTLFLNSGQVLGGKGTLYGILDTSAGGTVSGGDGLAGNTGTLTVTNRANLGGTAWMKLNGASSDKLVAPTITLGGTLVVTNAGGPLHVGDTFTLFQGALAGSFASIILPNYATFDTSQLAVNGTIRVTSYTPPVMKTDFSAFSSGTITFNITGGISGNGVSVLTTTNLASPIATWSTAATGNFDGSGNFSAPVSVDTTVPNRYYIMVTQ